MTLTPPTPNITPPHGSELGPAELIEVLASIQRNFDYLWTQFPLDRSALATGGSNNWIKPTLLNAWENYEVEAGVFANAMYRKGVDGRVTIIGLVKHPTAGAVGSAIFTLPVGYRPAKQLLFYDGNKRVDVAANGSVVCQGGEASPAYFSISIPPFFPN